MVLDIVPAQPPFKHERNLIVLPSLLLHDLNIYGMKGDWAAEKRIEENKTGQSHYCLQK